MKKLLIIFLLVFLCGCAKHTEIEDTAIVAGAAVDRADGQIMLTVETVNTADAKEGNAKGKTFSCKASSFAEASAKMATATGKPLYWDHLKLIVISEDALEIYLEELLEWLLRSAHSRIDTPLTVCKGSGADLLSLENAGNNFISDTLLELIDASHKNGYTVKSPAYILYNGLSSKSRAGLLPYIEIKEEKPVVSGCIALNKNKIAARLNDTQTQTALLLTGRLKSGEIALSEASFNITGAKAKNTVKINNKEALFSHGVSVTLSLEEIADNFKNKDRLSNEVREKLFENAEELLALSNETGCDFLMFKERLYNKDSKIFEYVEDYKAELILNVNIKSHGQSKYEGGMNE